MISSFWRRQPDDRLAKVRFLINHLNNIMPQIYTSHKELSLDKSMMFWRSRLVFRQYVKIKRHKYSVKFFELSMVDGLVLKFPNLFWNKLNHLGRQDLSFYTSWKQRLPFVHRQLLRFCITYRMCVKEEDKYYWHLSC